MRLTSIHLKNFRAAHDLTLPTAAPRVLIAGKNHAGKSSVKEAIRWALTGRASVTDAKGLGAERLIPEGHPAAEVTLVLEGVGGVSRSYGPGARAFAVEGFTGEASVQQQALYGHLGTTPAYLDAVLETGLFLRLHHADAKAMLLALLDVRVEIDGQAYTLDALDAAYRQAFEDRKTSKARLKAFRVPPMPTAPGGGAPPPTLEAIDQQLAKLRAALEQARSTTDQAAGQRRALEAQRAALQARTPFVGAVAEADLPAAIAAAQEAVRALQGAPEAEAAAVRAGSRGKVIALLIEHRPKQGCVLDPAVSCETAKIKFTLRAKELQALEDAAADLATTAPAAAPSLRDAIAHLQALQVMAARYDESAILTRDRATELARIDAALQALPADHGSAEEVQVLRERIQKGEALQHVARTYWTGVYQHQEALKEQARLTADVVEHERLCEVYGPNGARAEALERAVGAFVEHVNSVTAHFGWTLTMAVDPEWVVQVNGRPVETYSESEQFLIGIGVQIAIATISGLRFAVVDRLDMLDVEHRATATALLLDCDLDQVFILATREPTQALPKRPGLLAHRLVQVDGRSTLAETVSA